MLVKFEYNCYNVGEKTHIRGFRALYCTLKR